ncbi:MAG: hypothetical protein Kow0090_06370 [Myxococcota bacterium]
MSRLRIAVLFLLLPVFFGCDLRYPEVVVVNRVDALFEVRNISFNGCRWDTVLAFDEATTPKRCPPGEDKIHFQKMDYSTYCPKLAEEGDIDASTPCEDDDEGDATPNGGEEDEIQSSKPLWFNYQTISVKKADYGGFYIFELSREDMEQDFSAPSPYGH